MFFEIHGCIEFIVMLMNMCSLSKYVSVVYAPQLGSGVDDCKSLTASGARQMEVYRRARDILQVFYILFGN